MLKTLLGATTAGLIVAGLLPGVIAVGPVVEAYLFPITVDEQITDVEYDSDGDLCWTLTGRKLRTAEMLSSRWVLHYDDDKTMSLLIIQDSQPFVGGTLLRAGDHLNFKQCATIPAVRNPKFIDRIRVHATHSLWNIMSFGPIIPIPPPPPQRKFKR